MKVLFILGFFLASLAHSQTSTTTISGVTNNTRTSVSFNVNFRGTQDTTTNQTTELTATSPASLGYAEPTYSYATTPLPTTSTSDANVIGNFWNETTSATSTSTYSDR